MVIKVSLLINTVGNDGEEGGDRPGNRPGKGMIFLLPKSILDYLVLFDSLDKDHYPDDRYNTNNNRPYDRYPPSGKSS